MKKLISILCSIFMIIACGEDLPTSQQQNTQTSDTSSAEHFPDVTIDNTTFSYQKDNLPKNCTNNSEIVCAIENVIKCALNPIASYCDKSSMPDFIFYDDAMFADDNGLGRPTQQTFRIIKLKPLNASTVEVFTQGTCDKNWFGNCQGNIIYVMSRQNGKWQVKELYALESI